MATEEEKTFVNNESEGNNENEQRPARRPRFTRQSDGDRPQRPRFTREGDGPRYQRVERPQRPYQPRYGQDGAQERDENAPRFNRERFYGSDNRGEQRPYQPRFNRDEQRPYQGGSRRFNQRPDLNTADGEQRPYQPRYSRDGEQRPYRDGEQRPYQPRYNRDGEQRPYDRPQRPYQPRYNRDGEQRPYDRPQRPYQPRFEQGNSWDSQSDEGARAPRRPYAGSEGGYRQNNYGGNYRQGAGNGRGPRRAFGSSEKYNKKKQIQYREEFTDPNEEIRLNKYLANAGVCSRREADEFITAGVVTVNGVVVTELGTKVKRGDEVRFHDQLISIERKIYLLLNKPKDYVTTVEDPQDRKTVMDLVKGACKERIYPVGRLDRNTTGVLLLTNDGEMASKLTHPKFMKKKVYHVRLDKAISEADLERLLTGIELEDGEIRCDAVSFTQTDTDHTQLGVEIHSGRNRIVRRMFEAIGYHVVRLDRTQFAGLTKKNLRRGDWRFLTEKEVNMLRMGAYE